MSLNIETRCIHIENAGPNPYGAISYPIFQTATFAHPGFGQSTGYDYSRQQNPTREHLEQMISSLENGADALACSSGMAAISIMMELFEPGDHLIIEEDLYGGSIRLFDHISKKNHITFSSLDLSTEDPEPYFNEHTKAVFIETPTNPMMHITDIEKLALTAHEHGALLIVDNTFLSPCLQNPLDLGADIVIHSGTKYLSGHNDTLAGFLISRSEETAEKLRFISKTTGPMLAPFDSWLLLRGIQTLSVRMKAAEENASAIACWLSSQKFMKKVYYPGLPSHPGHEIMKKQARGFGAMVSFTVKNSEMAKNILNSIRLIQYAESLGGTETLLTYPLTQTHADVPEALRKKNGITDSLLRLSAGIEHTEDLLRDLDQAFQAAAAAAGLRTI